MRELKVTGLAKRFAGNNVIPDLTMRVEPGKVTALVGPNGAGKTTIFNLVCGLIIPDAGQVMFGDDVISKIPAHRVLRHGLARTFQEMRLFEDLTVVENLQIAREGSGFLRLASPRQLSGRFDDVLLPFGLEQKKHTFARDLSYAERKFLSLARVMSSGAELLLLDEPTSGLDGRSLEVAIHAIGEVTARNRTVLIIEHNLDVVRGIADEIMFLQGGRLVAQGTPHEIFARADLSEIYFGMAGGTK